jgi:hypothetical protein
MSPSRPNSTGVADSFVFRPVNRADRVADEHLNWRFETLVPFARLTYGKGKIAKC